MNLGIPLQQVLTRIRLELPGGLGWTMLRVALDEQVYVVVCNLQGENFVTEVVGRLHKQPSHIVLHYIENRVSILRTSDEVILAGTNRICVTAAVFYF